MARAAVNTALTTAAPTRSFYLAFRQWCLSGASSTACRTHHTSEHSIGTHSRRSTTACLSNVQLSRDSAVAAHIPTQHFRSADNRLDSARSANSRITREENSTSADVPTLSRASQRCSDRRPRSPAVTSLYDNSRARRNYSVAKSADAHGLAGSMRQALRTLTKPCVLVTTCKNKSSIDTYSGVTLSSFDAVTLHPVPHIAFNIKVPSRTYDVFERSKQICVHILNASMSGALVADAFTKPYEYSQQPFQTLREKGAIFVHSDAEEAPRLQFDDAVLSWILCEMNESTGSIDIGDHKICTFVVKQIITPNGVEFNTAQALAYGQRAFRSLGESIQVLDVLDDQLRNATMTSTARPDAGTTDRMATSRSMPMKSPSRPAQGVLLSSQTSHSSHHPKPIGGVTASTSFHTSSKEMLKPSLCTLATFRTTLWATGIGTDDAQYTWQEQEATPQLKNENILKETVDDFLCHNFKRTGRRLLKLRVAQKQAEDAAAALKASMADGTLTPNESERLEGVIAVNERYVLRALAGRAAADLNEMLDQGHVSASRVRYIEYCIEQGQAALLEEAKAFAQDGKLDGFAKVRLKHGASDFEAQDSFYRTVLMRLRDLYEDGEDGDFLD